MSRDLAISLLVGALAGLVVAFPIVYLMRV